MSVESAKAFVERIKTDPEFKKRVVECEGAEARVALLESEGHEFAAEDFVNSEGEIDDALLEKISGGAAYKHTTSEVVYDVVITIF